MREAFEETGLRVELRRYLVAAEARFLSEPEDVLWHTHVFHATTEDEEMTYTIVVVNNGPGPIQNGVSITDTLPAGTNFVRANGPGCTNGGGVVTCSVASLGVDNDVVITIVIVPPNQGDITNTVVARSPTFDPNLANNTASFTTDVQGSVE